MKDKKKEKAEIKKRLWNWGQAMEQFSWKEEELQKLQGFHEMQKGVWEKSPAERAKQELERIEKEYHLEVSRLRLEMMEILREKRCIDERIRKLDREEEQFLRLRFEKGYRFDYISMKMHVSRATLFRMQDRVLDKMISMKEESA